MTWLETLFSQQFELTLVFRLWDIFFIYGFSFMIKFTISILKSFEDDILRLHSSDLISFVFSIPANIKNDDHLVESAIKVDIPELDYEHL